MANVKISDLTALTSPAGTDELPVVDVSATATKKVTVANAVTAGAKELARGTAAAPAVAFGGDTDANTGIYSPGAYQVAISTGGAGRLFVDASGNVGVGTPAAKAQLHLFGLNQDTANLTDAGGREGFIRLSANSTSAGAGGAVLFANVQGDGANSIGYAAIKGLLADGSNNTAGDIAFALRPTTTSTSFQERLRITSTGQLSHIGGGSAVSPAVGFNGSAPSNSLVIDSSGRLLVGTSSVIDVPNGDAGAIRSPRIQNAGNTYANAVVSSAFFNTAATGAACFALTRSNTTTIGTHVVVSSGDNLGTLNFSGSDGTKYVEAATIKAYVDGTPGANDMPGRLVFSTTADGSSSPTERFRISSVGHLRAVGTSPTARIIPHVDNVGYLGQTTERWQAVYAVNGTIQTSDRRQKTDITEALLGSDFIKTLKPVSYKWIEGGKEPTGEIDENGDRVFTSIPGQRTHWGFIAQDVKEAVDAAGVDFGGWLLDDKDNPDSRQALRYDQFIAPLTKALQETMAELEALKDEVAALKAQ